MGIVLAGMGLSEIEELTDGMGASKFRAKQIHNWLYTKSVSTVDEMTNLSKDNTVKFNIIADSKSFDLDIGVAGQICVEDIKWIKDTDGKYKLVVIELD